jgi:hypothetical protein
MGLYSRYGTIRTPPGLRRLPFAKYPQNHTDSHSDCDDIAKSGIQLFSLGIYISGIVNMASMAEWNIYYSYIGMT